MRVDDDVLAVLSRADTNGKSLVLVGQLDRKMYERTNKVLEAGVGCEEIAYRVHGMTVVQRIPISLSFESLDEAEFRAVFSGICRHLAATYWPTLTADEIAGMIELMPTEAA